MIKNVYTKTLSNIVDFYSMFSSKHCQTLLALSGTNNDVFPQTFINILPSNTMFDVLSTSPFRGLDKHPQVRKISNRCNKCLGFMTKQDEAFVCVRCGKYKYLDRLPRANQELAEAFRPSIKTIRYKGEVPRFQNKMLDVQIVDNKYDTNKVQVNNRSLSFRYKFPCRYQRCGGDMKQGVRNPYRKEEGWKVVSFHCTKNDIHQNRIYENERGEAVNWE